MRNLIYTINLSVDGCCDHMTLGPEGITDESCGASLFQ
jgi:hypothetical protein